MAKNSTTNSPATSEQAAPAVTGTKVASKPAPRVYDQRVPATFEAAERLAPTDGQFAKIVRCFALDDVRNDVRAATEAHLIAMGTLMRGAINDEEGGTTCMNDKALKLHLDRITGAYVGSAFGAAQYYDGRRAYAKDLGSKFSNPDRDEDRDGPAGFEGKVARAQGDAATAAVAAVTTLAAAEGAIAAFEHVIGEKWKPYVANTEASRTVTRQAVTARASAFD